MPGTTPPQDLRLSATKVIAGCGVAALAIATAVGLPLGGGLGLPVLVVGGTALAITMVWKMGDPTRIAPTAREVAEMKARIAELEARLNAVETIDRFETRRSFAEVDPIIPPEADPMAVGSQR